MPRFPNKHLTPEQLSRLDELDARLAQVKGRPGQNMGISHAGGDVIEVRESDITEADLDAAATGWAPAPRSNVFAAARKDILDAEDLAAQIQTGINGLPIGAQRTALQKLLDMQIAVAKAAREALLILYNDNRQV